MLEPYARRLVDVVLVLVQQLVNELATARWQCILPNQNHDALMEVEPTTVKPALVRVDVESTDLSCFLSRKSVVITEHDRFLLGPGKAEDHLAHSPGQLFRFDSVARPGVLARQGRGGFLERLELGRLPCTLSAKSRARIASDLEQPGRELALLAKLADTREQGEKRFLRDVARVLLAPAQPKGKTKHLRLVARDEGFQRLFVACARCFQQVPLAALCEPR